MFLYFKVIMNLKSQPSYCFVYYIDHVGTLIIHNEVEFLFGFFFVFFYIVDNSTVFEVIN